VTLRDLVLNKFFLKKKARAFVCLSSFGRPAGLPCAALPASRQASPPCAALPASRQASPVGSSSRQASPLRSFVASLQQLVSLQGKSQKPHLSKDSSCARWTRL